MEIPLSSSSTRFLIASVGFAYPNAVATSRSVFFGHYSNSDVFLMITEKYGSIQATLYCAILHNEILKHTLSPATLYSLKWLQRSRQLWTDLSISHRMLHTANKQRLRQICQTQGKRAIFSSTNTKNMIRPIGLIVGIPYIFSTYTATTSV